MIVLCNEQRGGLVRILTYLKGSRIGDKMTMEWEMAFEGIFFIYIVFYILVN